jgi:hypothetical protein
MNARERERLMARLLTVLLQERPERAVRVPLSRVDEHLPPLGLAIEDGEVVLALGDEPEFELRDGRVRVRS